jgi:predicted AAA+ superfamily ATPase
VIDEVQKVPDLLNEVHWLIENRGLRFVLCGSSARKLKRGKGNLLGGRAVRRFLFPLVSREIEDFSLVRALNHGLLPRHYLQEDPRDLLDAYVGDYLREEIAAEAAARNVPGFGRFLEIAALANGEIVNFTNIARECGVSGPTVRAYYQILEDTLVGAFVPALQRRARRRTVLSPKFYFFDVGVVGALTRRGAVEPGSELFGRAFEHFILTELRAHAHYSGRAYPVSYWRTSSGFEVDFVLGDHEVAVEVKATESSHGRHLRGLKAFREEFSAREYLLVTLEPRPRTTSEGIRILPWREFLDRLWGGQIL